MTAPGEIALLSRIHIPGQSEIFDQGFHKIAEDEGVLIRSSHFEALQSCLQLLGRWRAFCRSQRLSETQIFPEVCPQ